MDIHTLYELYPSFLQITHALYIGAFIFEDAEISIHRLITALRMTGLPCEYVQESEYIYVLQLLFTAKQDINHIGSILTDFIAKESHFVFLSIGNLYPLIENWQPFYKRVIHGLNQRYFSTNSDLLLEYAKGSDPDYSNDLPKIRQSITLYLNSKEEASFRTYIEDLFTSIRKKHRADYLHLIMIEIFMTYHIYYHILEDGIHNINDFISSVLDEDYILENLKNTAISYGLRCMKLNDTSPSDVGLSKKIMNYIKEHYQEQGLSVSQIGDVFQLNSSYMGSIFKKVNNQSILQYITKIRMEASKELLETAQYKVSEIAELVGYADVFYFSKRFKKSYGCPPKDYALKMQNKQ